MKDVMVDAGVGVLPLRRKFRTEDDYAEFLHRELGILRRMDLGTVVLDHVIEKECTRPLGGIIAEFGVFSGVSINRMAARLAPEQIYGFDNFEGLPGHVLTGFSHGYFKQKKLPEVAANVSLVQGWFRDTLLDFLAAHPGEPATLLHIDCDLYSSTQEVLALMAERITTGTILVFDEIFNSTYFYREEMRAFYEFIRESGKRFEWIGHGYDVGCFSRLPGLRGRLLWNAFRLGCALVRRPPRLKKAAAVRIL